LISTSFSSLSKQIPGEYEASSFERANDQYDADKSYRNGKIFTLTEDRLPPEGFDVGDLEWRYLEGDGDFRSDEIRALRDEADIVVTNPPFSLFREFLAWLVDSKCQFLIIGNLNAISYIEVFPLLKANKLWLGNNYKVNGGAMFYEIPESLANLDQVREIREDDQGKKTYITRVQGVRWFTNIEHGRRHDPMPLMSEADVIRYSTKQPFEKYDNYDAIEVASIKDIPGDYDGVMGVPISFMDKYCPEQFELVGSNRGVNQDPARVYGRGSMLNGKETFKRLFIRRRT
jgi:hypothetical protein